MRTITFETSPISRTLTSSKATTEAAASQEISQKKPPNNRTTALVSDTRFTPDLLPTTFKATPGCFNRTSREFEATGDQMQCKIQRKLGQGAHGKVLELVRTNTPGGPIESVALKMPRQADREDFKNLAGELQVLRVLSKILGGPYLGIAFRNKDYLPLGILTTDTGIPMPKAFEYLSKKSKTHKQYSLFIQEIITQYITDMKTLMDTAVIPGDAYLDNLVLVDNDGKHRMIYCDTGSWARKGKDGSWEIADEIMEKLPFVPTGAQKMIQTIATILRRPPEEIYLSTKQSMNSLIKVVTPRDFLDPLLPRLTFLLANIRSIHQGERALRDLSQYTFILTVKCLVLSIPVRYENKQHSRQNGIWNEVKQCIWGPCFMTHPHDVQQESLEALFKNQLIHETTYKAVTDLKKLKQLDEKISEQLNNLKELTTHLQRMTEAAHAEEPMPPGSASSESPTIASPPAITISFRENAELLPSDHPFSTVDCGLNLFPPPLREPTEEELARQLRANPEDGNTNSENHKHAAFLSFALTHTRA